MEQQYAVTLDHHQGAYAVQHLFIAEVGVPVLRVQPPQRERDALLGKEGATIRRALPVRGAEQGYQLVGAKGLGQQLPGVQHRFLPLRPLGVGLVFPTVGGQALALIVPL